MLEQGGDALGRMGALLEPRFDLRPVEAKLGLLAACDRIEDADQLQGSAALALAAVRHDDVIEGLLLAAAARQANRDHRLNSLETGVGPRQVPPRRQRAAYSTETARQSETGPPRG